MFVRGIKLFFIVVSFMFFIGISDVSANKADFGLGTNSKSFYNKNTNSKTCSCYYIGKHRKFGPIGHDTVYAVQVRFTNREANDSCINDKYCTDRGFLYGGPIQGYVVHLCEVWRETGDNSSECHPQDSATVGNPFVDPEIQKNIVSQNCSVNACNTAKLIFWSKNESKEIVSEKETAEFDINGKERKDYNHDVLSATAPLKAITREQYTKLKNAESLVEEAVDLGLANSSKANIEAIMCWGKNGKWVNDKCVDGDTEVASLNAENLDCEALLSSYNDEQTIRDFLNNLFWIISIIGIILLIIMTSIEFIKVVAGQDDEGIIKAFKHTVIRAICVVILLLLPVILSAILGLMNDITDNEDYYLKDADGEIVYTTDKDGHEVPVKLIHIGANEEPLCGIAETEDDK